MPSAWTSVPVSDGCFGVLDGSALSTETAGRSADLVAPLQTGALIHTGITHGTVRVRVQVRSSPPDDIDPEPWEEVAEASIHAPHGDLRVQALRDAADDRLPPLPLLSVRGPGSYRLRAHARGRDTHHDTGHEDRGEEYLLIIWPAPQSLTPERRSLLHAIARRAARRPPEHPRPARDPAPSPGVHTERPGTAHAQGPITSLPEPADMTSLLVRTDYTDDSAWREAVTAASRPVPTPGGPFAAHFTVAENPSLDGVGIEELTTMPCAGPLGHLFVADAATMREARRMLLALHRDREYGRPGRAFRVLPAHAWEVQNNLYLANMDFSEFADAADNAGGVFRGFGRN